MAPAQAVLPDPSTHARPQPPAALDLRAISRALARGVAVLTALAADTPRGMTVSSFTPVSFDPPMLLAAVNRDGTMPAVLAAAPGFGLSVLAGDQEPLSRHFASRRRPPGWAQFADVPHSIAPTTGAPLLTGSLARFDCRTQQVIPAGDHILIIGAVLHAECRPTARPLLHPR